MKVLESSYGYLLTPWRPLEDIWEHSGNSLETFVAFLRGQEVSKGTKSGPKMFAQILNESI